MTDSKNPLDKLFPGLEEDDGDEDKRFFDGKTVEDDSNKEAVSASLEAMSADLQAWLSARARER